MKIINLETDHGGRILEELKSRGWKQTEEYPAFAFDKGIDFDSYTLKKDDQRLIFEWSNWFEWEVEGSRLALENLASEYSLQLEED